METRHRKNPGICPSCPRCFVRCFCVSFRWVDVFSGRSDLGWKSISQKVVQSLCCAHTWPNRRALLCTLKLPRRAAGGEGGVSKSIAMHEGRGRCALTNIVATLGHKMSKRIVLAGGDCAYVEITKHNHTRSLCGCY